jgi:hypothetical protein
LPILRNIKNSAKNRHKSTTAQASTGRCISAQGNALSLKTKKKQSSSKGAKSGK